MLMTRGSFLAPVWKARRKGIRFPTPRYISQKSGSRVGSNGSRSSGLISSIFVPSTRARVTHRGHEGVEPGPPKAAGVSSSAQVPPPRHGLFQPVFAEAASCSTISRPAARSVRRPPGRAPCDVPVAGCGASRRSLALPKGGKGLCSRLHGLGAALLKPPGGGPEPCGRSRSLRAWSWQPSFAGIGDVEHHQPAMAARLQRFCRTSCMLLRQASWEVASSVGYKWYTLP